MAQTAPQTSGGLFSLIPGGEAPDSQAMWTGGIVLAALAVVVLARKGIANGSAGHLHVSAADGVVSLGYMVIGLAALKTVAVRYADSPAGQALAWIVA